MRIGVLGTGMVGGALGKGWTSAGHEVMFGVRDAGSEKALARAAEGARLGSPEEAVSFAEVVALALPWGATEGLARSLGAQLAGKVVFDCTNALKPDFSGLVVGPESSGAELVAAWAPGARVVKIFNTTGFANMANPRYPEGAASMLYCGDDAAAKETARQLAADLGFDPVDAGPLVQARLLEPFALLWIKLAYGGHGRDIAFRLMKR